MFRSVTPSRCCPQRRSAGGTAGRFLWVPARSFDRPDDPHRRAPDPEPLTIRLPDEAKAQYEIPVCEAAERFVIDRDVADAYGEEIPAIERYEPLIREKVALVLSILHGSFEVADDDWARAGHVIDVSRASREWAQAAQADADQAGHDQQVEMHTRSLEKADRSRRVRQNTARRVREILAGRDWTLPSVLSAGVSDAQRPHL